jgi:hypothetical protein
MLYSGLKHIVLKLLILWYGTDSKQNTVNFGKWPMTYLTPVGLVSRTLKLRKDIGHTENKKEASKCQRITEFEIFSLLLCLNIMLS